ncbi:MAG: DUF523 domain-containing protein [Candidatus Aenigmarchaeota archaeon]|nr:DUF523 domain-containing protein [Candidatus Aenigmarchaeota archaeon]
MKLVSACLAGVKCRYDGNSKSSKKVMEMVRKGKAIPVCPEQLGGLTTPRLATELINGRAFACDGRDVKKALAKGAAEMLKIAKLAGCKEAILKAKSPSCGSGEIYDGSFSGKLVKGDGITAALLKKNGIKVKTEDEIKAKEEK